MSTEMITAFTTGLDGIKADAVSLITIVLPVALAITGLFMAVRFGIRFFKKSAN